MKLTLPAGAFDHVAKTVDLSSLPGTWNVNHLLAIVDDTLNVFLYVKGISTLGLSSFATSTVTLASVPGGAANGDTLTVFYDVIGAVTMAQSTSVTIASDQTAIPVSGTFTLPTGAATASLQTAGNSSLSAIATTLATQSAFTSSLWTDNSGAYYYSMITYNSGTNTFTVTWTTTGGASSSGPGAGAKPVYVAQTVSEPVYYVATASVGGSYTIGDILCHVLITNPNVSPATTTGLWVNTTTTAIISAPAGGNILAQLQDVSITSSVLPTGAATAANQATEITSLSTIATNSGLAATAAAQTTGNNSLATIVTQTTTSATAAGAPADSAANNSTSSWSIIALLKGLYSLLANVLKVGIYSVNGSTQAVLEPFQNIRVTNEGTPIYTDDFNGAALDANAWTTVLAGTGTATVSGGTLVLATGTTASNAAAISSTFNINSTGISAQKYRFCLQIEASTIAASDRFWGIGTPPVSFTSTTPIQDGIGFELQNGTLYAVVWNAGTRTKATALTVPTDGAYHSYTLQCKSNTYAWQIDSEDTSVATAAFVFPATTALPVRLHQINGASPPGTGPTFRVMSVAFNDISESNHTISDGVYGFRKMQVGANNAALTAVVAAATGGWSSWSAVGGTGTALLLATATAVKASSGTVKSISLYNASNKIAYLQIFDLATGSVTVGTTVPKESYPVPVGGYYDKDFGDAGLAFATAITICATTTSTGLTAPATGLNVNVEYK